MQFKEIKNNNIIQTKVTKLLKHRVIAWIIDFGIIIAYAGLLFLVANSFFSSIKFEAVDFNPYLGQLIGFLTLTLPVVTYSYMAEKSRWNGTIGKRLLKIRVLTAENKSSRKILLRNVLKFLPWELAHTGVHWLGYFETNAMETPLWIWNILIIPQVIMVIYFISIVISKGERSIYDKISATRLSTKATN